jgi:hypothetical protein
VNMPTKPVKMREETHLELDSLNIMDNYLPPMLL